MTTNTTTSGISPTVNKPRVAEVLPIVEAEAAPEVKNNAESSIEAVEAAEVEGKTNLEAMNNGKISNGNGFTAVDSIEVVNEMTMA